MTSSKKVKNNNHINITYYPGFSLHAQVLIQITLLMTGILQLTENVLLHSRAWTWPDCHHVNVPGTMDQRPLTTEKWMLQVDLQKRGAKVKSPLYWKPYLTPAHFSTVDLSRIPHLFRRNKADKYLILPAVRLHTSLIGIQEQRGFLEHHIQIFTLALCSPLLYCPDQNQLGFGSITPARKLIKAYFSVIFSIVICYSSLC